MLNPANKVTLARIIAVPFLVLLLHFPSKPLNAVAMIVFILVALTDLADGIIARRWNFVSNLGKFLDPLADKLLISSVLIMLVSLGWVQAWMAIVIIARELTVTGLRAIAADQGHVIAADSFGKFKAVIQVVALCPLILHYPWWGIDPQPIGLLLLYLALILTVISGTKYIYQFFRQINRE
ncbi:CDP-diacylglycerol--glycerol-3-phosphate 3-phosphatidyltransferase [Desulfonatronum thiosulfatophilum]|uniref:CDP-diacylglycerol--glycerol-3-phosphate 3-phosphatidyltransferase n=1 Tax=Desulfonatronum thiosulfatophilum TaxID=617002 RepID=A0A1G6BK92_9BACT|nr:CDP-diacylglycerol--glycerol-3-phosphate 3-phosphatidyltransferase [Desulfonatronum thiosulfatophilum]SDB21031.1 CDP-diacylglycerol--glycerol-3-phosphate 3-phosphatidyltransferase [Desulfonatronum thiosulfatophilum]